MTQIVVKRMNEQHGNAQSKRLTAIYEKILEAVNEGVHVVDDRGNSIIYNDKMSTIESMEKTQVLNRSLLDAFPFANEHNSTLLQALREKKTTANVKQTYFNNQGKQITTINNTFPIYEDEQIIGAIEIANDVTKMERMIKDGLLKNGNTRYTFEHIVGESKLIKEVIENAKRAGRTSSSVLIVGETGTGKELFAQSIHNSSSRASRPFVSQNCAAIPDSLMESILFGTKKGAFTGASDRSGLFEQADGGTLFLDEVNSLNPALQAKLLRVLQERTLRRIGETKEKEIDVRIIAAINEDPIDAISNNRIRKDLFYRLGVVTIVIPPLRERKEDMLTLLAHFINKYNKMFRMEVTTVSDEVKDFFYTYDWPGNVRELENIIEGAMNLMIDETEIEYYHLPSHIRRKSEKNSAITSPPKSVEGIVTEEPDMHQELQTLMEKYEEKCIRKAIMRNYWNVSQAARQLGISRQSLQYRIRKYNIHRISNISE